MASLSRSDGLIALQQMGRHLLKQSKFPPGWDEERVKRVLAHYEAQTEEEALAEDEAAFEDQGQTIMEIPKELIPAVRALIAKHQGHKKVRA